MSLCVHPLKLIQPIIYARFGSCGAVVDVPVGAVAVPRASVAVTRNVDYDFVNARGFGKPPYFISKPVSLGIHQVNF